MFMRRLRGQVKIESSRRFLTACGSTPPIKESNIGVSECSHQAWLDNYTVVTESCSWEIPIKDYVLTIRSVLYTLPCDQSNQMIHGIATSMHQGESHGLSSKVQKWACAFVKIFNVIGIDQSVLRIKKGSWKRMQEKRGVKQTKA